MTKEQTTGGATADLTTLLDRNRSFAEQFEPPRVFRRLF